MYIIIYPTIIDTAIDNKNNNILEKADYSSLDELLICLIIITVLVPILTIIFIQKYGNNNYE